MMDRAQKKKLYLTSLMVSVVATAIGSGAMGVMLSSIIDAYDLQTAQEGYMSSCISAGALAALLGGILLRGRVSKPAFIFWGGTLMSVMLLLKGTAIPFGVFLAVCTAMGLGMGVMDSFQSAFLADLIPERSAQGLGVLHGIFGVGGFALPLALHRLLAGHGWRQVYVMIGLVCLALMLQFGLASRKMAHDRLFAVKLETSGNFSQIRNFIPTLIEETDKIMSAQKARGADFESGNLLSRAKALVPILVPLFISAFRRADELATAMECCCYHGGEGRTKLSELHYQKRDYLAYLSGAALLAVMIVLRQLGL